MPGEAGFNFTISVGATQSGPFFEIPSSTGALNRTGDVLDDTDTTNAGFHTRLIGLLDSVANADFNFKVADSAIDLIESAYENRTELWVKVLPDGIATNGKKFPVVVESFNITLAVTDLVTMSAAFQGTGPILADDA